MEGGREEKGICIGHKNLATNVSRREHFGIHTEIILKCTLQNVCEGVELIPLAMQRQVFHMNFHAEAGHMLTT
jgi:hypothetical protein